ncbi:MAG: glycoside hydrolase family 19 protein [Cyanobacteria bacterium P01_G01_bin.38]
MKTVWGKLVKYIAIAIFAICCFCLSPEPAMAQAWGTVDFSQVTFNSLPAFEEPGSIASSRVFADPNIDLGYDTAREWVAGDLPVDVFKLGDFQSSIAAQYLNLDQISQLTGIPLESLKISDIPFFDGMTLNDFISGVPALGGFSLDEVPGIAGALDGSPGEAISDILEGSPELGDLNVSEVFGEVGISEIPNLELAELDFFKGWENANISDIPGLGDVELGAISDIMSAFSGVTGMHDVTYGPKEHRVTPTKFSISGGDQVGFSVQCGQEPGCMYVELEGPGKMHGAQWIAGGKDEGQQMVKGGFGILAAINGGKEPTGRHPFGDVFKVVLEQTNESEGTAKYALYFNVCAKFFFVKSCTPYFLGPVPMPLLNSNEKGMVITGLLDGEGGASSGLEPPSEWESLRPELPDDLKSILAANNRRAGYSSNPCIAGGGVTGDVVDQAVQAIGSLGWDAERARPHVELLIGGALEHGVTDPAHIAYILATAGAETSFRGPIPEDESLWRQSTGPGDYAEIDSTTGHRYYGRGYAQVTWRENYETIGEIIGVDAVSNPELLLEPENASQATAIGMRDGIFTGRSLSDYGSGDNFDWAGARTIINDGDKRTTIGGYGQTIYGAIRDADINDVENNDGTAASGCSAGDGTVSSPLGGGSLNDLLNSYQPADFQRFDAYRAYRNGWHAGIDLDYRANGGAGGGVNSVSQGTVVSVNQIGRARATGEPSVQVVVMTTDSQGRQIEQRYNHLSLSSVQAATGCGLGACNATVASGTQIGAVGSEDNLSRGAHLDYKVKIDGQFVDPWGFLQTQATGGSGTINTINISNGAIGSIDVVPLGTIAAEGETEEETAATSP